MARERKKEQKIPKMSAVKYQTARQNQIKPSRISLESIFAMYVQWGESSPAKHGGAYISAVVWTRILAITEKAIGRPQVPPNLVGFHLARIFGATGKEQPSPPLHLAAAARLLALFLSRDVRLITLDLFTPNHQDFSNSYLIFPSMLQIHYSP